MGADIFEAYLKALSNHRPNEYKIVVIDNAGFHSTKNINVPDDIHLLRIPPYSPELNPCEQVWQWIKQRSKNRVFGEMDQLKTWLHETTCKMDCQLIKSITANHHYKKAFYDAIYS